MSRRGGRQQPDPRRDQPFPTPSPHPDAGRGRGRGRARAPPSQQPPSSSSHSPAPVIGAPISPAPVVSAPISAPSPPPPSPVPVDALSSEVEQKLALRPAAPSSTKAIRFPDRPGFGRLGKKIQVRANHFQLQVAERDLHHYDVAITPEITSKKVTREVVSQLIKMYKESVLGNRLPVFDGRKNLFTAGPLPFSSKEFVVKLEDDRPKASSSSGSKKEKRERQFKVTIRFAAKVDLHHLFQFLGRQQLDCPQNTIQALDVALRATASEKYNVVGRSFFSPELGQTGPLGSGTEYWRGYYQSLRPTQMGLSLNIDVSARAFFEPIPVTEFVPKHFRNINFSRDQDRVKVKKALRGIRVDVFLGECKRSYKISGVSREPVKDLMFTLDDQKTKKSVAQYFTEKYKVTLKHANLPALQAGSDTKPIYLPMEVCVIAAGQRYTKRLNEEQVTALLRATCQRPQDRENYIKQIVKQHNFNNDKFVREFGISVKEDPTLLNARVLPPPRLKYHESGKEPRVDPWMGQWNMINKKMVDGGRCDMGNSNGKQPDDVVHFTSRNSDERISSTAARSPPPEPPKMSGEGASRKLSTKKKYALIPDNFTSLPQVTTALRNEGLESSNLVLGIDFTKSNEWTGKISFKNRSLHAIGDSPNPYEKAISIIGKTLAPFDDDNLIPCFGFGDATTHDREVFSFHTDDSSCLGFEEVLACYKKIVPNLRLSGPTSYAPVIEAAIDIVEKTHGQFHVLVIVADGQVTTNAYSGDGELSSQEERTIKAIVDASSYPLSIILVGVGDGPWEDMKKFDDKIPSRDFDNFQFVNFTEIMSKKASSSEKEAAFALAALMEIPLQYKAAIELGLLGRKTGRAKKMVPRPPPVPYSPPVPRAHFRSNMAASMEDERNQMECAICLTNGKDLAFGCGHMSCRDCGSRLSNCHICRERITSRLRVFTG